MLGCKWQDLSRSDSFGAAPAVDGQVIGKAISPGKTGRYLLEVHTSAAVAPGAGVPDGNMELVVGSSPVATLSSAPPSLVVHNGVRLIVRVAGGDVVFVRCIKADTAAGQRYRVNYFTLTRIMDAEKPSKGE